MKKILVISLIALLFACKTDNGKQQNKGKDSLVAENEVSNKHPEVLKKVLGAHGGLDTWRSFKTLNFIIAKKNAPETHTIALQSRKDKISTPKVSMGFDGSQVWLLDEKKSYQGDAVFYHNLMFYFYAMPFVLADDGIAYGETAPLIFNGKSYPGIQIGYDSGIGASPKDEYFLHYDPETYQMQWLGYTVTYRSGEKSENIKWIRYDDWVEVDGLVLPKSITWYAYEGREISSPKNTVTFENISLDAKEKALDFYKKPEKARFIN